MTVDLCFIVNLGKLFSHEQNLLLVTRGKTGAKKRIPLNCSVQDVIRLVSDYLLPKRRILESACIKY